MYYVHCVPWGQWSVYCLIGVAQIWIRCSSIYKRENVPGILYETVYLFVLYISYGRPSMLTDIRCIIQFFLIVLFCLDSSFPIVFCVVKSILSVVFLKGNGGRCLELTFPPSYADCLEVWEPQPPGILRAYPDRYRDFFTSRQVYNSGMTDLRILSLHITVR